MLFPTITFAVFLLLVFVGNWALMPRPVLWKAFILVASLVFYGLWDWRFVFLLLVSAGVNQLFAVGVERAATPSSRRAMLAGAVAVDLAILGWFKYYGFFVTSAINFLAAFGLNADLPLLRIALPVGISFLTFRVLSYVIDVYRGAMRPASALDFTVYVAFFPYIMAGPIARARDFIPQLGAPRDPRRLDSGRAFFLIAAGLVKKMLIADYVATHIVNGVFTSPGQYTSAEVLVGIVGYAVQIYCDFSAYTDIAIGVSLLLGFTLPDNFDAPYTAASVQDFWRRWHITLSTWLRDYLYIPLGGNRRGQARTYANLLLTMLLAGLWHGAAWTFVFWGALHGAGLVVERMRLDRRRARRRVAQELVAGGLAALDRERAALEGEAAGAAVRQPVTAQAPATASGVSADSGWPGAGGFDDEPWRGAVLPRVGVFAFVCLGWVFFRAASMEAAFAVLGRLFTGWDRVGGAITPALLLVIALGVGVQYVPARMWSAGQVRFSRLGPALQGVALALVLMVINVLGPTGPAEFLYVRF